MSLPVLHVCIATGQNAANLIPLEQYDARDVWILQTPAMRQNVFTIPTALKIPGCRREKPTRVTSAESGLRRSSRC